MAIYHHATTWGCAPHGHSSPNHGIGMARIMDIYHRTITRGMVMPSCGVAPIIAHSLPHHDIEMVRGNMGCDHAIAWDYPINSKATRAKRRGRGYPLGAYTLSHQRYATHPKGGTLSQFSTPFGLDLFDAGRQTLVGLLVSRLFPTHILPHQRGVYPRTLGNIRHIEMAEIIE